MPRVEDWPSIGVALGKDMEIPGLATGLFSTPPVPTRETLRCPGRRMAVRASAVFSARKVPGPQRSANGMVPRSRSWRAMGNSCQ